MTGCSRILLILGGGLAVSESLLAAQTLAPQSLVVTNVLQLAQLSSSNPNASYSVRLEGGATAASCVATARFACCNRP